jgi:hypothetical protein
MRRAELSALLVCLLIASEVPVAFSPLYTIYISTTSLPSGTVGSSYQGNLQALYTGAIPMPLLWKVYSGSLPPGLSLASTGPTTASISGTPTQAGSWTFTIEAYKNFTPGGYVYDRKQFTIDIAAAPPTEFDFSISVNPTIQAVDINNVIYGNEAKTLGIAVSVSLLSGTTRDVKLSVMSTSLVSGESPVLNIGADAIVTGISPDTGRPPYTSALTVTIKPPILACLEQAGSRRVGITVCGGGGDPTALKIRSAVAYLDLTYDGDLALTKVEPVQVLYGQDLIAYKSTAFRLTVDSTFWYPVRTHIRITFTNGWSLSDYSTRSPIEIAPGANTIYIPQQGDTGSLYPTSHPATERVTVDPDNQISERYEDNNDLSREEGVVSTRILRLLYQPVMFVWEASEKYDSLSDDWSQDLWTIAQEGSEFVGSTFPIPWVSYGINSIPYYFAPVVNVTSWQIPWTGETVVITRSVSSAEEWRELNWRPWLAELYDQLAAAAWLAGYDRMVGIVPPQWFVNFAGIGWGHPESWVMGRASKECEGAVLIVRRWLPSSDRAVVACLLAHELGHTYGVPEKYQGGEMSVEADEGFWISQYLPISPENFWSFMDYYDASAQYWVDQDTYRTISSKIRGEDPTVIAIRGLMFSNGTIVLKPFHLIEQASVDVLPGFTGTHYVVFLDSQGVVLAKVGFNATFSSFVDPFGAVQLDVVPFALRLGWDNRTRAIEIQDAHGKVLTRRLVSLNPPVVNVTFPAQGDTLTAAPRVMYNLTWSASDPDGDALSYSVLYSPDNGTTWFTLTTDVWNSYFVLNMAGFAQSNASVIRVVSSDGVNIGTGECRFKVATSTSSYVVQVQPQGIPSSCQVSISVDGTPVADIQGGFSKTFAFAVGTSHVIAVDDVVSGEMGIRYCLVNNSLRVSGPGICRFAYSIEYFLDVRSDYGVTAGSGWHTRNENVTFSVTQEGSAGGALGLLGVRYRFKGWSGDSNAASTSAAILMDRPKEVIAVMELDYMVPALVALALSLVAGSIWFVLKRRQGLRPTQR